MEYSWKQDPRLKGMNQEKLNFLSEYADRISNTPKNRLAASLMTLTAEANQKGIQFNDQETSLLISILSENLNPEEKKRLEMLQQLAKKLTAKP